MQFQTKDGFSVFNGIVAVAKEGFSVVKKGDLFVAVDKKGKELGEIIGETVVGNSDFKHTDAGKKFKLTALVPAIDPAKLIGKDPTTLSKDELVVLTTYLQELAAGKLNVSDKKEAKKEATKAAEEKTGKKLKQKTAAKVELPDGISTYEDLAALGAKDLWKKIVQPIAEQLEGITSRSKKDDMLEAAAKFFNLTPTESDEEEDELEEDELPTGMADSDEEDDEEEDYDEEEEEDEDDEDEDDSEEDDEDSEDEESDDDEDDEESEDEEEEEDEDEEEDDEDEEEDEEDEDDDEEDEEDEDEDDEDDEDEDDEEEDELKPADIDAMESKEEIMAVIRKYKIELPKKKLSVGKVKAFIKQELFGDDE
jgi:hypothetical protein